MLLPVKWCIKAVRRDEQRSDPLADENRNWTRRKIRVRAYTLANAIMEPAVRRLFLLHSSPRLQFPYIMWHAQLLSCGNFINGERERQCDVMHWEVTVAFRLFRTFDNSSLQHAFPRFNFPDDGKKAENNRRVFPFWDVARFRHKSRRFGLMLF